MKIGPLLPFFFFRAYVSSTPVYVETTGNPSVAETSKKTSTHDLIRHLLDQDLGTRKFSFPDVVMASSGKKVIPSDSTNLVHQLILDSISKGANEAIAALSAIDSPVRKLRRINEASRFFEDWLRQSINKHPSLVCSVPKNTQGKEQRSGYPDLLITYTATDGATTRAYLDPKLFEKKSQASSFRTFYFEPRARTNKIQHEAMHLLLGISHDGNDGAWTFTSWKICDLSLFQVRLKAEFQASNRDLYRPNIIIKSSSK